QVAGEARAASKFATPVWDPGAEWERAGAWCGTSLPGNLDGPRLEVMFRGGGTGFQEGWPYVYWDYDPHSERIHAVAFSGRGLLDGPFSRARYGGVHYAARSSGASSPDGRYGVFTDPCNGDRLRVMDFKEQMVRTILPDAPLSGIQAVTFDSKNRLWTLFRGGRLAIVDIEAMKIASDIKLNTTDGIDMGFGASIALDEKKNRLYACGTMTRSGWHVWYFDMNDGGTFHGVLKGEKTGPQGGYAGPFDGYKGYGEGSVYFGPDDPDYRFLYMRITDTSTFVRLDLERRMVAACSGPPRGRNGPVKFIEEGAPNSMTSHVGPIWLPDGDFRLPGLREMPSIFYRRVK
ncbi:MAG: hypothetical protein N3A38_16525, partial [Planctomycetota bacterium]|nr:hypothetical protein [Planctomycetota bacterium]